MGDPIVQDSKLSALICIIGFFIVICGFMIWPISDELFTIDQSWLWTLIDLLDTEGSLFTVIFWCSRPTNKTEWVVILIWIMLLIFACLTCDLQHINPKAFQEIMLATLATPCTLMLFLRIFGFIASPEPTLYEARLKWLVISILLIMIPIYPALMLNKLINEKTFDVFCLRFDTLLSPTLIPNLRALINTIPNASTLLEYAYGFTPLGFLAVALLQLRGRPFYVASALLVWVTASMLGTLAYNFFPITGPNYVFDNMNDAFLHASAYPLKMVAPEHGFRNGMPSMHLGWMLGATILWWQCGTGMVSRFIMVLQTVLVILATLYFGEHYLIDLIVAVPFMLSMIALCTTTISIYYPPRIYTILLGLFTWMLWVVLLRTELAFFVAHPAAAKYLVLLTFIIVGWQIYFFSAFKADR